MAALMPSIVSALSWNSLLTPVDFSSKLCDRNLGGTVFMKLAMPTFEMSVLPWRSMLSSSKFGGKEPARVITCSSEMFMPFKFSVSVFKFEGRLRINSPIFSFPPLKNAKLSSSDSRHTSRRMASVSFSWMSFMLSSPVGAMTRCQKVNASNAANRLLSFVYSLLRSQAMAVKSFRLEMQFRMRFLSGGLDTSAFSTMTESALSMVSMLNALSRCSLALYPAPGLRFSVSCSSCVRSFVTMMALPLCIVPMSKTAFGCSKHIPSSMSHHKRDIGVAGSEKSSFCGFKYKSRWKLALAMAR
mmetsp:Transcript_62161/g.180239  ORF Transcript_62161/g.180239 Transcript_62161/m.180239 type:complete len:300 (+) Transcript_62161:193-1092(+)